MMSGYARQEFASPPPVVAHGETAAVRDESVPQTGWHRMPTAPVGAALALLPPAHTIPLLSLRRAFGDAPEQVVRLSRDPASKAYADPAIPLGSASDFTTFAARSIAATTDPQSRLGFPPTLAYAAKYVSAVAMARPPGDTIGAGGLFVRLRE